MRKLAIISAIFGIFTLAACGGTSPATTPTAIVTADPVMSATENAGTTNDSADSALGTQDVTFTANIGTAENPEFAAAGRYSCLPPTTQTVDGATTDIPGAIQISGVDERFRMVAINLPFGTTPGEYEVGMGDFSVAVTIDPSAPETLYRSVSGTITIEALPEGDGEAVTGSFRATAENPTEGDSLTVTGEFDFLTDNTSTLCR